MGLLLVGFFLFCFLNHAPAYAVTIVDVATVSRIITTDYVSDCEWWETIEIRTTTRYREPIVSQTAPILDPEGFQSSGYFGYGTLLGVEYPGVRHPCYPDPDDKGAVIPAYCTAEVTPPAFQGGGFSFLGGGVTAPITFREWTEVSTRYDRVHHNECHSCSPDPVGNPILAATPEPTSWLFALTGLVGVLLFKRKQAE